MAEKKRLYHLVDGYEVARDRLQNFIEKAGGEQEQKEDLELLADLIEFYRENYPKTPHLKE